jgi:hypothetical protein
MSLSGAATNMSRYDAQSSTMSGTPIQTMSRDPGMLHRCRPQLIGGWLNSAFLISNRAMHSVQGTTSIYSACSFLLHWALRGTISNGRTGSLGTSVKVISCQQADEVPGLAIATTMRREYFRGLVSHVARTAALTAAYSNLSSFRNHDVQRGYFEIS